MIIIHLPTDRRHRWDGRRQRQGPGTMVHPEDLRTDNIGRRRPFLPGTSRPATGAVPTARLFRPTRSVMSSGQHRKPVMKRQSTATQWHPGHSAGTPATGKTPSRWQNRRLARHRAARLPIWQPHPAVVASDCPRRGGHDVGPSVILQTGSHLQKHIRRDVSDQGVIHTAELAIHRGRIIVVDATGPASRRHRCRQLTPGRLCRRGAPPSPRGSYQ
jgi:hypothetical protein